ncbi:hypothetical protein CISG_08356 [Coccidioides immitis RMSCC 3703]|uniref:SAC3/GANP/THP3 conserved domain-containing protein n=1 Tax=Coccidioides immitis RMSCC 3703 TaxID=454286 RepID=A0A0J8R735_COCIT|nr:hypothetical protein CISG_08356 [Coccidioides immitis RMSCC 3703]
MVDKSEKLLNLDTGELDIAETRMIKRFRRSAAGYDEQLPSDIRTPNALLQTLNYILRYVISDDDTLGGIHKFVWDRTRSIRNDLSIQQLTQQQDVEIAVICLERDSSFPYSIPPLSYQVPHPPDTGKTSTKSGNNLTTLFSRYCTTMMIFEGVWYFRTKMNFVLTTFSFRSTISALIWKHVFKSGPVNYYILHE